MKTAIASAFRAEHPNFVPLGNFIEECTEIVRPFDEPEKEWPVYGVNNQSGVFFSHWQRGMKFNAPYKRVEKDWFFHNPTRANVGSIGRVSKVEENALTSPEYQVWRVKDPQWLPDFIEILIQMTFFKQMVQVHRVGAVKERLYAKNLMEIPVPMLSLNQQQLIVKRWQGAIDKAIQAEQEAINIEDQAMDNFVSGLSLENLPGSGRKGAFSILWSQLERWDTFFWRPDFAALKSAMQNVDRASLGTIANFTSRAWKMSDFPSGAFRYIEISSVHRRDGVISASEIEAKDAPSRATTLVRKGDLILSTTRPYLGSFAIIPEEYDCCVCSSGFALIDSVNEMRINKDFLLAYLTSPIGLKLMEQRMTGGLYPAITGDQLSKIEVPTPSLETQKELVAKLESARAKAVGLRERARDLREHAKYEIELTLLSD